MTQVRQYTTVAYLTQAPTAGHSSRLADFPIDRIWNFRTGAISQTEFISMWNARLRSIEGTIYVVQ